jgi:heat shock protein HslJ
MQGAGDSGTSQVLVVNQIVATEESVACDPLATDRPFTGTPWLIETDGEVKHPGYRLKFGDRDRFEGSDGCNLIFGRFRKSDHQVIIEEMLATMRACPDRSFHEFELQSHATYEFKIQGRVLTLSLPSGPPYRWLANEWDAQ